LSTVQLRAVEIAYRRLRVFFASHFNEPKTAFAPGIAIGGNGY
jgi:hypothetical protein